MKLPVFILAACWASAAAAQQAAPRPSLFFNPAETAAIEGLLVAHEARVSAAQSDRGPVERPVPPDVHMGALIYMGPNDWVVWLNGARRTAQNRGGELEIAAVTPERAEIVWRGDTRGGPLRIRLRPYQTFVGTTGEILEGILTPAR